MKKHIAARQDRNRELAEHDAANRCASCRQALPKLGVLIMLTPGRSTLRYCNETCQQDHIDALQTREARR